ncbi:MAG: GIY-YIG nuclease family protein, partial [Anaerolineae bacterium]|nr:GIY-YIG nuclease family protein [Anaerolineae bacterium]
MVTEKHCCYTVYKITCTKNGRAYVGVSNDAARRWRKHKSELAAGSHHNPELQADYERYGLGAFRLDILEDGLIAPAKAVRENVWISSAGAKAYNATLSNRPCVWNGVRYPTVAAAARASKIKYQRLLYWISQGYTDSSQIPTETHPPTWAIPVIWNGVQYESITAAAAALGIHPS